MKKSALLMTLPLAALLMAGCSAAPAPENGDTNGNDDLTSIECDDYQATALETEIKVCGIPGELEGIEFTPLKTSDEVRTDTLMDGDGGSVEAGKVYYVSYSAYNAQTGEVLFNKATNAGYTPVIFVDIGAEQYPAWMTKAFAEHQIGSRIAIDVPVEDAGMEVPGLAENENILWVFDIKQEIKFAADGEDQTQNGKLPTVTLGEGGWPTVDVPNSDPSPEFQIEVLKKGTGNVVPEKAEVWVHYQGVNWRTGEVFDESWSRGQPSNFKLSGVVEGFSRAIAGQTVGSQVIVSFPPELGYGVNGNPDAGIEGTDTLVFTVDILASVSGT